MAELILTGAEVRSGDFGRTRGRALAVAGGRILAVGETSALLGRGSRETRVVRLRGGTLLPGFIDAHLHFRALARRRDSLDCADAADAGALLEGLRRAAGAGEGWLFAHGLEHRRPGFGTLPALEALDRATAGRPLWLRHRSGHLSLFNSAALRVLGLWRRDPPEGGLERRGGRPTGLAHEVEGWVAARLRGRAFTPLDAEAVAETARALLRLGVTAFAELTATNQAADLDWWRAEQGAGRIPQAVSLWVAAESLRGRPLPALQGPVRLGGIKVLLRQGAQGLEPGTEELAAILAQAARGGWSVAIHAVEGDALVHALEALRLARARPPFLAPRLRLEHLNLLPPALVEALGESGASACVQPGLLWAQGEIFRREVPRGQQPWLFPLAGLRRRAAALAIGSDAPAAPASLLRHLSAALTRRDRSGRAWGRAERIGLEAALVALTEGAARVAGFAGGAGKLQAGSRADAVYFAEPWLAFRRAIERGEPTLPAGTLVGGAWQCWR